MRTDWRIARRPWPAAQERAWVYREQLEAIVNERLRARFLEMVSRGRPCCLEASAISLGLRASNHRAAGPCS